MTENKVTEKKKTLNTHETNIGMKTFPIKYVTNDFCSFNKGEINYHFHVVTDFLF